MQSLMKKYPELSGSYPESANSKSQNPESGIGGKMPIGTTLFTIASDYNFIRIGDQDSLVKPGLVLL